MVSLALTILYVSFARANLERVESDEKYDKLRKISISYQWQNESGEKEFSCYKLPESNILPNNLFYFLKKIRDDLWIQFSHKPIDKAKIILLVADKKIAEAIILQGKNINNNLIDKNIKEAFKKLEMIEKIVSSLNKDDLEIQKIIQNTNRAKFFYQYVDEQQLLSQNIDKCDD